MEKFLLMLVFLMAVVTEATVAGFVRRCGSDLCIRDQKFVPVGFNAYWLGLDEEYRYPSRKRIEEMFQVAQKMSATVIRSHTVGHSSGSPHSLRPWGRKLNNAAWGSIDTAVYMARLYNIRLIVPLTDNWWWYNGNYSNYCTPYGLPKQAFWTDRRVTGDFKDYIWCYLNHVNAYTGIAFKDDPYIFLIETGNELGGGDGDQGSNPPESWIREITAHIKGIDVNHLILDGSDETLGRSNNFHIDTVDVYSRHTYSENYDSIFESALEAARVGKPFIIGEFSCHASEKWLRAVEANSNVKGTLFWNLYGHDDNGSWIRHGDGFTLYYKENSSQQELLRLANHARRMQGLPEIAKLPSK